MIHPLSLSDIAMVMESEKSFHERSVEIGGNWGTAWGVHSSIHLSPIPGNCCNGYGVPSSGQSNDHPQIHVRTHPDRTVVVPYVPLLSPLPTHAKPE
jgi:hypothetical protein